MIGRLWPVTMALRKRTPSTPAFASRRGMESGSSGATLVLLATNEHRTRLKSTIRKCATAEKASSLASTKTWSSTDLTLFVW